MNRLPTPRPRLAKPLHREFSGCPYASHGSASHLRLVCRPAPSRHQLQRPILSPASTAFCKASSAVARDRRPSRLSLIDSGSGPSRNPAPGGRSQKFSPSRRFCSRPVPLSGRKAGMIERSSTFRCGGDGVTSTWHSCPSPSKAGWGASVRDRLRRIPCRRDRCLETAGTRWQWPWLKQDRHPPSAAPACPREDTVELRRRHLSLFGVAPLRAAR